MSFGFAGATDRDRYRFLSGFKLNDQGKNEDPTYLGFSMDFDFGILGIDTDYGTPISPLFKEGNYTIINSAGAQIPFIQPDYNFRTNDVLFYSAQNYLTNREQQDGGESGSGFSTGSGKRSQMLKQFKILLRDITKNQPWFFQSIEGLDALYKVARPGYQDEDNGESLNPSRSGTITVTTLESLNLRMTALADLYNHATFDFINMRETIPRNLRRFRMYIYVTDLRNFFKTNRLINSSTTLTTVASTANLIGSGINPGNSLSGNSLDSTGNFPDPGEGGSLLGNNLRDIAASEGLTNQQDQSGIKPVILIECSNCEFDFSESSPVSSNINAGTDSGEALGQSFKIHVGRVRIRSQYPNIRLDKNPLIISDDVFTNKSSVQIYDGDPSGRTIFGIDVGNGPAADLIERGANVGTNFIGNTVNDLYDRGVQLVTDALSGVDQVLLGNIYSFNPSQVMNSDTLSLNTVRDFATQASTLDISSSIKNGLPNPQTMGQGGPPQNTYSQASAEIGNADVYSSVPGSDLGVTPVGSTTLGRNYPDSIDDGDAFSDVPGSSLGVPDREYKNPEGDVYNQVPGRDLGSPQRVYPKPPNTDTYPGVPGPDLGVPQRTYPNPSGDFYPDVPGSDLGVPDRVYPVVNDDAYPDVPGFDLGVPDRRYPAVNDDVYADVPGSDLGVPDRRYGSVNENVYAGEPEKSNRLVSPDRIYEDEPAKITGNLGDLYKDTPGNESSFTSKPSPVYPDPVNRYFRGTLGDIYPPTSEDFQPDIVGDLGNTKAKDSYNISLGGKNPDPAKYNT